MPSLATRLSDLITAVGTDIKQLRIYITGTASGNLTGLTTTDKTSLVAAVNEVKAGSSGAPPDSSETVKGIIELATQVEMTTGTDDVRAVTPLKHRTDLTSFAQPLDSDLTAIAALTTTAYGRAFLALADQAALMGLVPAASETVIGKIELATQTEVNTGTDTVRAVVPLTFQTRLAAYAQPLDSDLTAIAALTTTAYGRAFLALVDQAGLQALLGLDIDTALTANSDAKIATQKAVKAYVDGVMDANNAFTYKGVVDCSTNPNYPAASAGWSYKVSVAGKIGGPSGPNVEVGDTLVCTVDGTASNTHAIVGANWMILQTNIDGAVVGPASSTAANLPTFSGTTGKVIQDSGVAVSTDGTMVANVNTKLPTEAAIRTYLAATYYNQTAIGNPDVDLVALFTTAKA